MTIILVLMRRDKAKYVNRKFNIADFQCKNRGKCTLNVNIKTIKVFFWVIHSEYEVDNIAEKMHL